MQFMQIICIQNMSVVQIYPIFFIVIILGDVIIFIMHYTSNIYMQQ